MSYAYQGLGAGAGVDVSFDVNVSAGASPPKRSGPAPGSGAGPGSLDHYCADDGGVASVLIREDGSWGLICNDGLKCAGKSATDQGLCKLTSSPPPPPPPPPPAPAPYKPSPTICPPAAGSLRPAGLSQAHLDLYAKVGDRMVCSKTIWDDPQLAPIAAECNASATPTYCYFAKVYGQSFLGRGSASDVAAWQAWHAKPAIGPIRFFGFGPMTTKTGTLPSAPPMLDGGPPPSDGVPTWALVLGGVAIVGGVAYLALRKKALSEATMSYGNFGIIKIQNPSGEAGMGPKDCGTVVSSAVPPGVSNTYGAGYSASNKLLCDTSDPIAALCNTTGNPPYCFYAKKFGTKFLGRGTEAELNAWATWTPGGGSGPGAVFTTSLPAGGGAPATDAGGVPTWAIVAGGVAVVGMAAFFLLRR